MPSRTTNMFDAVPSLSEPCVLKNRPSVAPVVCACWSASTFSAYEVLFANTSGLRSFRGHGEVLS